MIDDNWQEDYGKWDFHPGRFRAPKTMINSPHHIGLKVMLWVCPFVSPDCDVFRELGNRGDANENTGGKKFHSNKKLAVSASLEKIPFFIRLK